MRNEDKKEKNTLPANPVAAIRELIKLTRNLIKHAEKEEHALAKNDFILLAAAQEDKEQMAWKYAAASEEFRARIEEFRGADRKLLDELEKQQNELSERSTRNSKMIEQMYNRARTNTQKTLLAAQEIGQKIHIRAPETAQQQREGVQS